jgi:ribose/xylose/arabinose/galactoside ABC-type transport system permease subunit
MIAMARAAVRVFSSTSESEIFKQIVLLCAAGLLVSLLMLTYGLDLSPGFF